MLLSCKLNYGIRRGFVLLTNVEESWMNASQFQWNAVNINEWRKIYEGIL